MSHIWNEAYYNINPCRDILKCKTCGLTKIKWNYGAIQYYIQGQLDFTAQEDDKNNPEPTCEELVMEQVME